MRNSPRCCKIGITSALNTSSIAGRSGGMMLKPSAAPSVNQSSIRSATCSGVPAKVKWPRAPARLASSCRSVGCSRRTRPRITSVRLRAASTDAGVGKVVRRERPVERQMREVVAAEPAGQALAPDLRIGQLVGLAGQALRLGLGGGDHRAQARAGSAPARASRPSSATSRLRSA